MMVMNDKPIRSWWSGWDRWATAVAIVWGFVWTGSTLLPVPIEARQPASTEPHLFTETLLPNPTGQAKLPEVLPPAGEPVPVGKEENPPAPVRSPRVHTFFGERVLKQTKPTPAAERPSLFKIFKDASSSKVVETPTTVDIQEQNSTPAAVATPPVREPISRRILKPTTAVQGEPRPTLMKMLHKGEPSTETAVAGEFTGAPGVMPLIQGTEASHGESLPADAPSENGIIKAGCASCANGGGVLGLSPNPEGALCGCGSGHCAPGHAHCSACESSTYTGRFFCGLYECICCPDPCYEPKWLAIADAAFFVAGTRPVTQQRMRWDAGYNLLFPDRAEFFWARADGQGRGPNVSKPGGTAIPGAPSVPDAGGSATKSPFKGEKSLRYNELSMYTEAATGLIGVFTEIPYRSIDPELANHAAGFGDITVGTKTLLFDCELLQIAFQFSTMIPAGDTGKGLGNGHVSLEPSLLFTVKLHADTYLQTQLSEWIPIAGDPAYAGAIFHYHTSLNQVICKILPDVPLIATFEVNGWMFQDGAFTDPILGSFHKASLYSYVSLGSGLRLAICDKIDFGVGAAFAVTDQHFAEQLFRSEFRWRF